MLRSLAVFIFCVAHWIPISANASDCKIGVPAEFERQQFVLLNWNDESEEFFETYSGVVRAAVERSEVIMMVPNVKQYMRAATALEQWGIEREKVRFALVPFDTIWVRDYGPILTRSKSGATVVVDADYEPPERFRDDAVPTTMAAMLGLPVVRAPITLDGGAILSNGKGLCLVSKIIFDQNQHRNYDEDAVRFVLQEYYGFKQVEFIDPLEDESTGHLDMFATFVSANTILVGSYDHAIDPVNADRLDDVADQLSHLGTPQGKLQVVRIPMPTNEDGVWRSFTNAVFINGILLVPSYPEIDNWAERTALQIYRELLPGWMVKPIPCTDLIRLGGGIHCVSMNIADLPEKKGTPLRLIPGRLLAQSWSLVWDDDDDFDLDALEVDLLDPAPDLMAPSLFDSPLMIP